MYNFMAEASFSACLFGFLKGKNNISGVNKSARERIGRQNLSQKVPSKKGSLGVIFSLQGVIGKTHTQKTANFEGRHSGGHLLGRPLLFTSEHILAILRQNNGKGKEQKGQPKSVVLFLVEKCTFSPVLSKKLPKT